MLPPRELHLRCLRCGRDLAPDLRQCPACGADRELELAIAAELLPTVSSLRRWLLALAGLRLVVTAFVYEEMSGRVPSAELIQIIAPGVVLGVFFIVLAAVAHRLPFATAVIAMALFGGEWLLALLVDPAAALMPGIVLMFRIMLAIVLAFAVRSGYRAHMLARRRKVNPAPANPNPA